MGFPTICVKVETLEGVNGKVVFVRYSFRFPMTFRMWNVTTNLNVVTFCGIQNTGTHLSTTEKKGGTVLGNTVANESRYMTVIPIYS